MQAIQSFDERGAGLQVAERLGASSGPGARATSADSGKEFGRIGSGSSNPADGRQTDEDEDGKMIMIMFLFHEDDLVV